MSVSHKYAGILSQYSKMDMIEEGHASEDEVAALIPGFRQYPTSTPEDDDDASVAEIEMQQRVR